MRRVLERYGYHVLVASTPGEAVQMAGRTTRIIHLLLSDLILPEMSGRTMASLIVRSRPGTKVLYMSGYVDEAVLNHGFLGEGIALLQKPFTPDVLARKVREVLG